MLVVTVNSTLEKFLPGKDNIFKGTARDAEGRLLGIFVKVMDTNSIELEAYCGALGRKLLLPVLGPLLVEIPGRYLPPGQVAGEGLVAPGFGTLLSQVPLVGRPFREDRKPNPTFELMLRNKKSKMVAAFDELIDNNDRNPSNILYDGGEEPIFIDHGMALRRLDQPTSTTDDNWLFLYMRNWEESDRISAMEVIVESFLHLVASVEFKLDVLESVLAEKGLLSNMEAIRSFLDSRRTRLTTLIETQLRIAQLELEAL